MGWLAEKEVVNLTGQRGCLALLLAWKSEKRCPTAPPSQSSRVEWWIIKPKADSLYSVS